MDKYTNTLEEAYLAVLRDHDAGTWPEHELPGGKVRVSPDGMKAIVLQDGRYPNVSEGYQINDFITETAMNLFGVMAVEFPATGEIRNVLVGDSASFGPNLPFSISGKCICLITMSEPWQSSQKHYVKWDPESNKYIKVN